MLLRQRSLQQQRHWVTFIGLLLLLGMTLACVTLYKNWVTGSQVRTRSPSTRTGSPAVRSELGHYLKELGHSLQELGHSLQELGQRQSGQI